LRDNKRGIEKRSLPRSSQNGTVLSARRQDNASVPDNKRKSYFQKEYVKTGLIDVTISKYITSAFQIRNESDYEDFYLASKSDEEEILAAVGACIQTKTING
jgi:hypothetical protein